jgi:hypothetical protein
VLRPGFVEVGAGVSGQLAVLSAPATGSADAQIQDVNVAPAVSPWMSGRVGIAGDNEAGLTFTGRNLRVDARHAFSFGAPTLSVGLGASALVARPPGRGDDGSAVYGGGLDLPVLLGVRSRSDLYALWIGPRVGIELLRGRLKNPAEGAAPEDALVDLEGQHLFVGGLAGLRAGFRHVHVAIEASVAYHRAWGTFAKASFALDQLTVTPGGALIVSF